MAFDFRKEYKDYYLPGKEPQIITIPKISCIAVYGSGDPNPEDSEYKDAVGLLYDVAYTIKMSKTGEHRIDGYFDFMVPPLEGFWWQEGADGVDRAHKEDFKWISLIRLPDFVKQEDIDWAKEKAEKKKKRDFSKVQFLNIEEGLCVQCMHLGSFDDEPATVELMDRYIEENGYENDFSDERRHHEIYLSDARKVALEKLKTIIRHPIRKKG